MSTNHSLLKPHLSQNIHNAVILQRQLTALPDEQYQAAMVCLNAMIENNQRWIGAVEGAARRAISSREEALDELRTLQVAMANWHTTDHPIVVAMREAIMDAIYAVEAE